MRLDVLGYGNWLGESTPGTSHPPLGISRLSGHIPLRVMVDKQENKWKHLRPFKVQVQKWYIIFSKTLVKVIWPNPTSRDGAICFTI